MLLRIVAPHFVAGLVFLQGSDVAYRAAPIIGYMRGWPTHRIWTYCQRKGWQVEKIN